FSDLAGWVGDVVDAKKQNKELKAEVKNLHGQLADLATAKREAAQLSAIMQVSTNLPKDAKTVTARVIAHSPTVWYSTIQIDKGRNDGLRVNHPAITAGGRAGKAARDPSGERARGSGRQGRRDARRQCARRADHRSVGRCLGRGDAGRRR